MKPGFAEACGTALTGKFCSGCGAPADNAAAEGWSSLANQLLSKPRPNGILSVALSFLRHPVDTIIRLTDDPTYRSQWAFLSTCLGAQLTLSYVLLPRLYSALLGVPDTADTGAVITNEIVQYVGIAILTPIQFYVCRALGNTVAHADVLRQTLRIERELLHDHCDRRCTDHSLRSVSSLRRRLPASTCRWSV